MPAAKHPRVILVVGFAFRTPPSSWPALCRPSTSSSLPAETLSVIAGLDPAIHAMTLPLSLRGDFTRRPFQPPRFF
jgi:hypothetical protein